MAKSRPSSPSTSTTSSSSSSTLSAREQREALRAEKLAELRGKQAAERRRRRAGIILTSVVGMLVVAVIVTFVVLNGTKADQADDPITGLQTFASLPSNHIETLADQYPDGTVDYQAEYGTTPPAGGNHSAVWLNCAEYNRAVPNENAVHSLEHGAIWVTYDPSISDPDLQTLRGLLPTTKTILSPFNGLPSPVVISAWGAQLQLTGADDPRLGQFIAQYWNSPNAPEPNAICSQGVDAPGRVAGS